MVGIHLEINSIKFEKQTPDGRTDGRRGSRRSRPWRMGRPRARFGGGGGQRNNDRFDVGGGMNKWRKEGRREGGKERREGGRREGRGRGRSSEIPHSTPLGLRSHYENSPRFKYLCAASRGRNSKYENLRGSACHQCSRATSAKSRTFST